MQTTQPIDDSVGFRKYAEIENVERKKYTDHVFEQGFGDEIYIVQEKGHGSNFSVWANDDVIKFAKRSGFIGEEEAFYGYETMLPSLMQKISNFSPMNWGIHGYYEVFLRNANTLEVLPDIGKLLLFSIVTIGGSLFFRNYKKTM